jgi:hypothetical protein
MTFLPGEVVEKGKQGMSDLLRRMTNCAIIDEDKLSVRVDDTIPWM